MIKRILLLLSVVLASSTQAVQAQLRFGEVPDYSADLALIKSQPLVVLLDEVTPKELRKWANKPRELAQYKAYIAFYNARIQEYAPKLWHSSSAVIFKPASEYEVLVKAKGSKTLVFQHTLTRESQTASGPMGNRLQTISFGAELVARMKLSVVGDNESDTFWVGPAPVGELNSSDIISSLRALQLDIDNKAIFMNSQMKTSKQAAAANLLRSFKSQQSLPTKILLINQANLEAQLTETDIKKLYPFPFQLVPLQTIEMAVVTGDVRYAYARRMTQSAEVKGVFVVDAATGENIAVSISKKDVGKADFKEFAQIIAKSENPKRRAILERIMRE